eukprot:2723460-Pleurochrysis_carterae.AAC.1
MLNTDSVYKEIWQRAGEFGNIILTPSCVMSPLRLIRRTAQLIYYTRLDIPSTLITIFDFVSSCSLNAAFCVHFRQALEDKWVEWVSFA